MQPAQLSLPLLPDHAPKTPPTAMIALPEPALTAAITVTVQGEPLVPGAPPINGVIRSTSTIDLAPLIRHVEEQVAVARLSAFAISENCIFPFSRMASLKSS